jgi:hypothetical protein
MKKMQLMENLEQNQSIEQGIMAEGESESTLRTQMHSNIKDTIVNLVNTLHVIEREGRDLVVKASILKRNVES